MQKLKIHRDLKNKKSGRNCKEAGIWYTYPISRPTWNLNNTKDDCLENKTRVGILWASFFTICLLHISQTNIKFVLFNVILRFPLEFETMIGQYTYFYFSLVQIFLVDASIWFCFCRNPRLHLQFCSANPTGFPGTIWQGGDE